MTDRDAEAEKLAGAMGWYFLRSEGRGPALFEIGEPDSAEIIPIPAADAPLHAQLEFVGRLCAELPGMDLSERLSWCAAVCAEAADLPPGDAVHAAIRAAIEARRAT